MELRKPPPPDWLLLDPLRGLGSYEGEKDANGWPILADAEKACIDTRPQDKA